MAPAFHRVFFAVSVTSAAMLSCGPGPQARSKALEVLFQGGAFFYVEGQRLVRTTCPEGTQLLDRAHCNVGAVSAPVLGVDQAMRRATDAQVAAADQKVEEARTRLRQVDARITELLAADFFTGADAALVLRIENLERDIARRVGAIASLEDQIVRLEVALASREDPDVREQLLVDHRQLVTDQEGLAAARQSLNSLRQQWAETQTSANDPMTFQLLKSNRVQTLARLDAAENERANAMQTLVAGTHLWVYAEDHGFSYDLSSGEATEDPALQRAIDFFLLAFDEGKRIALEWDVGARTMSFRLPTAQSLVTLSCNLWLGAGSPGPAPEIAQVQCPHVTLRSPAGREGVLYTSLYRNGMGIGADCGSRDAPYCGPQDPTGVWTIALPDFETCWGADSAGLRYEPKISRATCTITVR